MVKPTKFRRKIYLVKTKFQLKYTGIIILFMFGVAALSAYTVYYTGWLMMGERLAYIYPQGRLVSIMGGINKTLLLRLLLVTPIVAFIAILLSHRVAGPLFRIERFLKSVAKGNLGMKLRLRREDELQDLAEAINEMTNDLSNRLQVMRKVVNMADLDIENLSNSVGSGQLDAKGVKSKVQELEKKIRDLHDHLSEYRLTTIVD